MKIRLIWCFYHILLWHCVKSSKLNLTESQQTLLEDLISQRCPRLTSLTCSADETQIKEDTCCTGCSCDKFCGLYSNCCYEEDDLYKLTKNGIIQCLYPGTRFPLDSTAMPMYEFVVGPPLDGCRTAGGSCISNVQKLIPWKTFSPVFSRSKRMNYVTEDCAKCHGVTDTVRWGTMIKFESMPTKNFDVVFDIIFQGINKGVLVDFIHPGNQLDSSRGLCSPKLVKDCSNGIENSDSDFYRIFQKAFPGKNVTYEDMKLGCLMGPTIRTVFTKTLYKNVFCVYCRYIVPSIDDCKPQPTRSDDVPFTVIIDHKFIPEITERNLSAPTKNFPMACKV